MSHIYMEFSKSIQSIKKHYFYSHQKQTKLVYEICLIPIVLWGMLKNKFMIFALEDGLKLISCEFAFHFGGIFSIIV